MHDRDNTHPASSAMDGDGVRVVERTGVARRPALLYKALALVLIGAMLVGGCATYLYTRSESSSSDARHADTAGIDDSAHIAHAAANEAPASASSNAAAVARRMTAQSNQPGGDPSPDLADALAGVIRPGEEPSGAQVIAELNKAGIHTGIGAFPPPGTSPPMVGLAVPDDYALPEGYVRHYQATDDGQRIEPILMFSPDYQFFDASGKPIAIPENRVVPPGMAPDGLTARPIKIPPPLQPGKP